MNKSFDEIFVRLDQVGIISPIEEVEQLRKNMMDIFDIPEENVSGGTIARHKNTVFRGERQEPGPGVRMDFFDKFPVQLEYLSPLDGNSAWMEYHQKVGKGIHHVRFDVSSHEDVMKAFQMNGRNIAVTGAAGNLGIHFAEGLAQAGANLALMDMPGTEEKLNDLKKNFEANYGIKVSVYALDIGDEENVKLVSEKAEEDLGPVDGLLNVAGINHHGTVFDYSDADLDRIMHINVVGTYSCCKWFGKKMCERKRGSIVNIASMSGYIGNYPPRTMAGYGISKAGVHHLTKCIAAELGAYNVRVNSISPGFLEKGMSNVKNFMQLTDPGIAEHNLSATPMHRVAKAEELVGAAVYLLSEASSFTTGIDILIDGGYMLW